MTSNNFIINKSPLDNQIIDEYKISDEPEIQTAFSKARQAQKSWSETSLKDRCKALKALRQAITADIDDLVDLIARDSGKTNLEALMADIYPSLELIKYYEKRTDKFLAPEKRSTPLTAPFNSAYVEYQPLGVVAVISPWNYPFQLAINPAITAIAAGNAVILKPSEVTPTVGQYVGDIINSVDCFPDDLIQVIQGYGKTGAQVIEAEPDKVFFTGSVETGKKIMKAASQKLIPVELELGGKDPMIVFNDANLIRAARAAVYGGFANTGQSCVSVERLYVQEDVAEEFIELIKEEAGKIRFTRDPASGDIGPFTHPEQEEKVENQLNKALDSGAKILYDGRANGQPGPIIIGDIDHDMKIAREETFGPVIAIKKFKDKNEAIKLANDSDYGLNSSVWSKDIDKAKKVASSLETGNCMINDLIKNIGNPDLPFGGAKKSGIGRYHGPEGLRSFTNQKSIMINKSKNNQEINWFPYNNETYEGLKDFIEINFGAGLKLNKIPNLIRFFLKFLKGGEN
ncbi:MAG: aldehyde dehydrogenase family protein [Bacillota bacterium]